MNLLSAMLAELRHRWISAVLTTLVVAFAVSAVAGFVILSRAAEQETRVVQRDIGLNVLILSDQTVLTDYYAHGFAQHDMPAEYVERLADQAVANRLVPLLRRRVEAQSGSRSMPVMLTGIGQEVFKGGKKMKAVFGKQLAANEVVIGGEVAAMLQIQRGDSLELFGESLHVTRALAAAGTAEDVTVYGNLKTVQRLMKLEGRINEIQAIECHCGDEITDPLAHLKKQLEALLPGTRVLRRAALADARRSQRLSAERFVSVVTPVAALLGALLVAVLSWLNMRERRAELGLLRTLGFRNLRVSTFLLGRTLLIGLAGAAIGCLVGERVALDWIPRIYSVTGAKATGLGPLWPVTLALASLCTLAAASIPIVLAMRSDPAEVLSGE
ncbi:MAG: putative ABC transport system permease protein [Planctomycetota bacterium]|jgi:putative ABC transport system permease protein